MFLTVVEIETRLPSAAPETPLTSNYSDEVMPGVHSVQDLHLGEHLFRSEIAGKPY
jgi:hypothetical protein